MTHLLLTVCLVFAQDDTCLQHELHVSQPLSRASCAMEVVGYLRARVALSRVGQLPTLESIRMPVIDARCACECEVTG
jgi:hypothetical protein